MKCFTSNKNQIEQGAIEQQESLFHFQGSVSDDQPTEIAMKLSISETDAVPSSCFIEIALK